MNWIVPKEKQYVQIKLGDVNFHGSNVHIKFEVIALRSSHLQRQNMEEPLLEHNPPGLIQKTKVWELL